MEKCKDRSMFSFAGKYKYLTILGCILSGISAIISLVPYICIWKVVEEIFNAMPNIKDASNVNLYAWLALIFSVGTIIIYLGALMCTHIAAFRIARNMRSKCLHHLVKLPLGYFDEQGSGKIHRIINESSGQTEAYLAHQLPDLVGAIITPIVMISFLLIFDWRLGIISLIPTLIAFFFAKGMMGKKMKIAMEKYQNALEDMNNEAVEYVRGIPVVKTFGQSIFSFKNFHDSIVRYKKFVVDYTVSLRPPMCKFTVSINAIFAFLIPATILLIGSVANQKLFLLNFIFYILFTPVITVMINRIMFMGENSMLVKDATKRINSILNQKVLKEIRDEKIPDTYDIDFSNVTFSYSGSKTPALKKLTFRVQQGSTVALVGPSGGGKTTAASLIPRFWDVDSGSIRIGGIDQLYKKIKNFFKYF